MALLQSHYHLSNHNDNLEVHLSKQSVPSNLCSQEIPSNFIGKFSVTASIHDSIFATTYSQLEIFHNHCICNHCSLKFPQPQIISRMRHPDVHRTYTTLSPHYSRLRKSNLVEYTLDKILLFPYWRT